MKICIEDELTGNAEFTPFRVHEDGLVNFIVDSHQHILWGIKLYKDLGYRVFVQYPNSEHENRITPNVVRAVMDELGPAFEKFTMWRDVKQGLLLCADCVERLNDFIISTGQMPGDETVQQILKQKGVSSATLH